MGTGGWLPCSHGGRTWSFTSDISINAVGALAISADLPVSVMAACAKEGKNLKMVERPLGGQLQETLNAEAGYS